MPELGNRSKIIGGLIGLSILLLCGVPLAAEVLPYGDKVDAVLNVASGAAILRQAPDGDLWLAERASGRIRLFRAGETAIDFQIGVDPSCDAGLLDLAFDPDFVRNGRFFISLVDASGTWRVVRWRRVGAQLFSDATLVNLGPVTGCQAGGALLTTGQRTLWVATGDQQVAGAAQVAGDPRGKLLRLQTDGSVPTDNPVAGSLIYASGLRDPRALIARSTGEPIIFDQGRAAMPAVEDELNLSTAAGNLGWDVVSGASGGAFDDPLFSTVANGRPTFARASGGSLLAPIAGGGVERYELDSATESVVTAVDLWFDPDGDADGTVDVDCPRSLVSIVTDRFGEQWAVDASGSGQDLYRFWSDQPGPAEVSPPGSPFPLRLTKSGAELELRWQQLDARDIGLAPRPGMQAAAAYRIWEGALPLTSGYNAQLILESDGAPLDGSMRSALVTPGVGSRYYLVSAQGDNLEGSLGRASDGTPRGPNGVDHCEDVGVGRFVGDCLDDFRDPVSGQPMKLIDYNPASPTYLEALSLRDFRGQTVVMEIAAQDCFWCELQGPTMPPVVQNYAARDFMIVTVLNASEIGRRPYPDAATCAQEIADWASRHGATHPILCDLDLNGDNVSDVTAQYWHAPSDPQPCGGFGQNFFVDSGGVIFDFICSLATGEAIETIILPEINAEVCE